MTLHVLNMLINHKPSSFLCSCISVFLCPSLNSVSFFLYLALPFSLCWASPHHVNPPLKFQTSSTSLSSIITLGLFFHFLSFYLTFVSPCPRSSNFLRLSLSLDPLSSLLIISSSSLIYHLKYPCVPTSSPTPPLFLSALIRLRLCSVFCFLLSVYLVSVFAKVNSSWRAEQHIMSVSPKVSPWKDEVNEKN